MEEQLTLFTKNHGNHYTIYIDGAARNNPGPAGIGIVIKKNEEIVVSKGYSIGIRTNNQAEYAALIVALLLMQDVSCKASITIFTDSQLLAHQLNGLYKVKESTLQQLYKKAKGLLGAFDWKIKHILRDKNKEADQLANIGIDDKKTLPKHYINLLHEIA